MVIRDLRTIEEAKATEGFMVAHNTHRLDVRDYDWKTDKSRLILARPVRDKAEADMVRREFNRREHYKHVRYAKGVLTSYGRFYKPKMAIGDYLHVFPFDSFIPYQAHVGVGQHTHLGEVQNVEYLADGITFVSTSSDCALLLSERRVSDMLPMCEIYRDNMWRAWADDGKPANRVMEYFDLVRPKERIYSDLELQSQSV